MPSMPRPRPPLVIAGTVALGVLLDQATKAWVRGGLAPGESWPAADAAIARVFAFTHVHNTGIAFGMFQGMNLVMLVVALVVIAAVLVWRHAHGAATPWLDLAVGLVVAGASGNAIDRVHQGYVTDFLDFRVWPVFNVADTCVFVGVVLLSVYLWRTERQVVGAGATSIEAPVAVAPDGRD
jgi:signal peptidase II